MAAITDEQVEAVRALVAAVPAGRVTTYGDVLLVDDVHGVERVATVTPAEWFPGHLG